MYILLTLVEKDRLYRTVLESPMYFHLLLLLLFLENR
jgi:hypothetical protein